MVLSVIKQTVLNFFRRFQIFRPSKLHAQYKIYGNFAALVDFYCLWSCIRKGMSLQPSMQACLLFYIEKKIMSFFKVGSKQILVRIIGLSKKTRLCVFFSGKGLYPQNLKARTNQNQLAFFAPFSFLPDFLKYFLECQLNLN